MGQRRNIVVRHHGGRAFDRVHNSENLIHGVEGKTVSFFERHDRLFELIDILRRFVDVNVQYRIIGKSLIQAPSPRLVADLDLICYTKR